jgi:UDP-glucose 4-epimerase
VKAIITGGAGFIGSHLAKRLLREGWSVLIIDNLSSGYLRNVPDGGEFKWVDVTHEDCIQDLPPDGVDVVFHLASHVGQDLSFEKPLYDLKANALSTMILLKWCQDQGVRQFIFASSVNVYGDPPEPFVTESSPIRPPSPYAVGKIASEYLCNIYQSLGLNTTSLRLFNVYGPGQDMQNMRQGMASIYMAYVARKEPVYVRGSMDRFRDFVSVHDVVDAFYRSVNSTAFGKTYNVCTGKKTLVSELIPEIIRAFGHDPATYPVTFGPPTRKDQFGIYGDSSLLQKDLGWKPTIELREGIAEMAAWVKKEGII